jgi:putative tryptophan/tyrosine transport system substrate-binding protein
VIRRDLILIMGGTAVAWPAIVFAQHSTKVWRIGWLSGGRRPTRLQSSNFGEFLKGMEEFGYVEGRHFIMEWRFAETRFDRIPDILSELIKLKIDVLVVSAAQAIRAAQLATSEIPIVMAGPPNPVASGFVASLARPGGNTTGQSSAAEDMVHKHIDLLIKTVPKLERISMLVNPQTQFNAGVLDSVYRNLEEAAKKAGIAVSSFPIGRFEHIEPAFRKMNQQDIHALIVPGEPFTMSHDRYIAKLALDHGLPSICWFRQYAAVGGLMSYGEKLGDLYRRSAFYVDKIMKGAKPADLPIQQPTRFYLTVNRKTAEALKPKVTEELFVLADEVIE